MKDTDPVEARLEELRDATAAVDPPDRFDDLVWSQVERRSRRPSPWLALVAAAFAALTSFVVAWRLDARLAERVLVLGDDASAEAP